MYTPDKSVRSEWGRPRKTGRVPRGAAAVLVALWASMTALPLQAQQLSAASAAPAVESRPLDTGGEAKPRSGWAALPLIAYSPETELNLGGFGAHFFRLGDAPASSRPSTLAAVAIYTTRDQIILELIPELYWDSEKWHIWSKLDYRYYPNSFWGVGNHMPDSDKENYTENTPRWQCWLRRMIVWSLYLEARVDAQYMAIADTEPEGLLDTKSVPGASGGRALGLGGALGWDSRDDAIVPHEGAFYELSLMGWNRAFLSEYDFSEVRLNLRQFIPVTRTHVLALQLYGQFLSGEAPFYKMAMVGGQRILRGYYEGRYLDNDLLAAQAEYRLPIWWRISAVAFAAVGDVSDNLSNFSFDRLKWGVGAGGRLMLNPNERLNLRADFALAPDSWGLYVGIAEAF